MWKIFWEKSRVLDFPIFFTRIEPVLTPYYNRLNPYFFVKTLGFGDKPWVSPTRIEPVLTPYLPRI